MIKRKLTDLLKKHLTKCANLKLGCESARYSLRLTGNACLLLIYSMISIILLWLQSADLIVLGLNILCLFRSALTNTVNASEVNDSRSIDDITINRYTYYHIKSAVTIVASVFAFIVWCSLVFEHNTLLTKVMATFMILLVCANDCEDIAIYAFKATVPKMEDLL